MRKLKELHAEKMQQQEKRIRQEDEQLATLRKAKQLAPRIVPPMKDPGLALEPV